MFWRQRTVRWCTRCTCANALLTHTRRYFNSEISPYVSCRLMSERTMDLNDIFQDIAAFADDENDVIIEKGLAVFQRNRQTYECRLLETPRGIEVAFNGATLPYKKFLAEELGRLTILAEAIRQKRKDIDPYIDT